MQQDIRKKQTQKAVKQQYEKPQLGMVRLVADQVLSCFTTGPCNPVPIRDSTS